MEAYSQSGMLNQLKTSPWFAQKRICEIVAKFFVVESVLEFFLSVLTVNHLHPSSGEFRNHINRNDILTFGRKLLEHGQNLPNS